MAKVCAATGRKTVAGNNRSHALNSTKRTFKSNLQKKRVLMDNKVQTVYLSTRALKNGKALKKAGIELV